MDFGQSIKTLRQKEQLTQEQFAMKLNVTRQAVSNWENNKNLPDIGMLILMSNLFDISLDELIKGEGHMNNMTEKIIHDGSETTRAKYHMVTISVGAVLLLIGVLFFLIKRNSVEYIDAEGIYHENFYLIPLGYLLVTCGSITILVSSLCKLWNRRNKE